MVFLPLFPRHHLNRSATHTTRKNMNTSTIHLLPHTAPPPPLYHHLKTQPSMLRISATPPHPLPMTPAFSAFTEKYSTRPLPTLWVIRHSNEFSSADQIPPQVSNPRKSVSICEIRGPSSPRRSARFCVFCGPSSNRTPNLMPSHPTTNTILYPRLSATSASSAC